MKKILLKERFNFQKFVDKDGLKDGATFKDKTKENPKELKVPAKTYKIDGAFTTKVVSFFFTSD